jgi:hypothetical protein
MIKLKIHKKYLDIFFIHLFIEIGQATQFSARTHFGDEWSISIKN